MLCSIVYFITLVASNSAFIFCFCNLIIVIILRDLKRSLSFDQESEIPVSMANNTGANHKQGTNSKCLVDKNTRLSEAEEVSEAHEAAAVHKIETEGSDNCSNEAEEGEEEEEDELRRRVEECIEKSEAEEVSEAQEAAAVHKIETEGSDNCSNEAQEDEEEEEDELRRRVEEFIEKINRGWKAELLSKSCSLEARASTQIVTDLNHLS